jgi:hypothetical protein
MASSSVIGALRVVLGVDTASFETGLKKATSHAESFSKSVSKIATGIGLERAFESSIAAIVGGFKKAILGADQLGKAAEKVGLPVEEFTRLQLAAEMSDVSVEQLGKGLGILSKTMTEVAGGGGEKAAETFKKLGVSITEAGKMRSVSDVFIDLAGAFSTTADGATKTTAAMTLMKKGGRDMLPMLNEGKEGLQEWAKAAERMGLVISQNTAAQSDKLGDNFQLLSKAGEGLANVVAQGVLPAFVRLSNQWVDTATKGEVMRAAAEQIIGAIKETVVWIYNIIDANNQWGAALSNGIRAASLFGEVVGDTVVNAFQMLKEPFLAVDAAIREMVDWLYNKLTPAWEFVSAAITKSLAPWQRLADWLGKITGLSGTATTAIKEVSETTGNIVPVDKINKARAAWDAFVGGFDLTEKANANRAAVDALFASLDMGTRTATKTLSPGTGLSSALLDLKFKTAELRGEFDHLQKGLPELLKGKVPIDQLKNSTIALKGEAALLNIELQKFNQAKLNEEFLTPYDQWKKKLEDINSAYKGMAVGSEAFAEGEKIRIKHVTDMWEKAAVEISSNIASGLKAFAAQNKSLAGAAKIAAIAAAVANTYVGASKALALYGPTPLGFAAAAAAVIAGLGYVAQIQAQSFAKGGSFKVPGGMSGTDNKLVPLNLASGEMVNITPSSQVGSGGGGMSSEVTIKAKSLTDLMTLEDMRNLINGLNAAHRDGYRLKVVTA